jgi:hypothetical protein
MANTKVSGRIGHAIKETYQQLKAYTGLAYPDVTLSVGARLQANNEDEIIITHTGSTITIMKGSAPRHNHDISVICFSKSYVSACAMADMVFANFSAGETIAVQANADIDGTFYAKGQTMYYTDEDDYAVAVNVTLSIVDKTNL